VKNYTYIYIYWEILGPLPPFHYNNNNNNNNNNNKNNKNTAFTAPAAPRRSLVSGRY
jgi:hypothetical protein